MIFNIFSINFLKKSFLLLIVNALILLIINWKYSVKNLTKNDKKAYKLIIDQDELNSNYDCFIRILNEWDNKIKPLFKKIPVYSHCKKNQPFTYIANSTIYYNELVNKTFYQGFDLSYLKIFEAHQYILDIFGGYRIPGFFFCC